MSDDVIPFKRGKRGEIRNFSCQNYRNSSNSFKYFRSGKVNEYIECVSRKDKEKTRRRLAKIHVYRVRVTRETLKGVKLMLICCN